MNAVAFIETTTTLNDLYGNHNCPIVFRAEVYAEDDKYFDSMFINGRSREIVMVPDEDVLGNGIAVHGMTRDGIASGTYGTPVSLEAGLQEIYEFLSAFSRNRIYVAGYKLPPILKNLNENFQRVINRPPIELDEKLVVDVEKLARICVPVRKCGNYCISSVAATVLEPSKFDELSKDPTPRGRISTTRAVLAKIAETSGIKGGIGGVVKFLSVPHDVRAFPTGKYKGAVIDEIAKTDKQYLSWILKNRQFYENDQDVLRRVSDIMNSEES